VIGRLVRPLDAVNAGLDSPPTSHRRRAMPDVVAWLLTRCGEPGAGSYWDWTADDWVDLLGRTQAEFRAAAPAWVGDEVRRYLAAQTFLLGGFNEFHRLGSIQRLALCWRVFGRDLVSAEIVRLRMVLAGWGYRLGRADDPLLPLTVAALMLLNRSPHLEDLTTDLFDRVRDRQHLYCGSRHIRCCLGGYLGGGSRVEICVVFSAQQISSAAVVDHGEAVEVVRRHAAGIAQRRNDLPRLCAYPSYLVQPNLRLIALAATPSRKVDKALPGLLRIGQDDQG
jgi:hypothetical protein